MNIIYEEILINSVENVELVNITNKINQIIRNHNIKSGLINISTKHTTSGIIINEDETGLKRDIINFFEKIVPNDSYFHNQIDNNARSHLKSVLSSQNQTLPIKDSKMNLGTWQSIFFIELDGPRMKRTINITIIGTEE